LVRVELKIKIIGRAVRRILFDAIRGKV